MAAARRSVGSQLQFLVSLVAAITVDLVGCTSSIEPEGVFLSGSADTTETFFTPGADGITRHHLVCFHRGDEYASTVAEGRQKCCLKLYQSGLIEEDDRGYCLDHVAMVPGCLADSGGVRPAFYLGLDEAVNELKEASTKSYRQSRQLNVLEDKESEGRDVEAYSPFHLSGLTTNVSGDSVREGVLPLEGRVEGTISSDGGMHRAFHQSLKLSLAKLTQIASSGDSRQVAVNATILLPISENIFIDADDPLLVEYDGSSPDGVMCKASVEGEEMAPSSCSIDFVHPETIDIEQPAFASRQYVVAYSVSATIDLSFGPNQSRSGLEIDVDYGTTLHLRYPPPITSNTGDGLVPVVIQQPLLYSASASFGGLHYELKTTAAAEGNPLPDPIVIHVAAGSDSDYQWVTLVTMLSALVGGLLLMVS